MSQNIKFIDEWFDSLVNTAHFSVESSLTVTGSVNRHFGGMSWIGSVEFLILPYPEGITYSIDSKLGMNRTEELNFARYAAYGFLDVVLTRDPEPLSNFNVSVTNLTIDPTYSTCWGFRIAGRDAGNKYLELLESL